MNVFDFWEYTNNLHIHVRMVVTRAEERFYHKFLAYAALGKIDEDYANV